MSLVERLLEEMGREPEAARRLARQLAADIASEGELRSLLLEALLREAATKDDVHRLGEELGRLRAELAGVREKMATREELHAEIHRLGERMDTLMKWMIGLLATIWGTVAAIGVMALKLLAG